MEGNGLMDLVNCLIHLFIIVGIFSPSILLERRLVQAAAIMTDDTTRSPF